MWISEIQLENWISKSKCTAVIQQNNFNLASVHQTNTGEYMVSIIIWFWTYSKNFQNYPNNLNILKLKNDDCLCKEFRIITIHRITFKYIYTCNKTMRKHPRRQLEIKSGTHQCSCMKKILCKQGSSSYNTSGYY